MGDPPCFNQPLGNMMGHLSKPSQMLHLMRAVEGESLDQAGLVEPLAVVATCKLVDSWGPHPVERWPKVN